MTPRTSVRAAARDYYADLVRKETRAGESPATGDGRSAYVAPPKVALDLMTQARALYEETAVPVREIAACAGVSERTLYKYVGRGGWKRRYACRGEEAADANRGRRRQTGERHAPAKGAGGRFVRREEAGKPHPRGLKALDPAGRAAAEAACADAARLASEADLEAGQWKNVEALIVGIRTALRCVRDYDRMARERAGHALTPLDGSIFAAQSALCDAAIDNWNGLTTRWYAGHLRSEAACAARR